MTKNKFNSAAVVQELAANNESTEKGTMSNVQVKELEKQFAKNRGYAVLSINDYEELDSSFKQCHWDRIDISGENIIILEKPIEDVDII